MAAVDPAPRVAVNAAAHPSGAHFVKNRFAVSHLLILGSETSRRPRKQRHLVRVVIKSCPHSVTSLATIKLPAWLRALPRVLAMWSSRGKAHQDPLPFVARYFRQISCVGSSSIVSRPFRA